MKLLPCISAQDWSGGRTFKDLVVAHRLRRMSPLRVQNPYHAGVDGSVLQRLPPLVCGQSAPIEVPLPLVM
ncbi:hypothetical protein LI328DRAFT_159268 [Trichoderma asperelloides]|nr:hypothetical protein LI328DRAFT_159268 [Trichoderma asperelloides]